jgi:pilus assembly protein CpaB
MVKGRALVVVLALILATLATAGVFLYARGVEEDAKAGGTMVSVVVSEVDIPPRTDLNLLIRDDLFRIIQVNEAAYVDGAITSVDQLADKNNAVAILAGEQIPQARITGNVQGGALSIPEGMEALTVSLDAPRGVAGLINTGDSVTIYSTFKEVARRRRASSFPARWPSQSPSRPKMRSASSSRWSRGRRGSACCRRTPKATP